MCKTLLAYDDFYHLSVLEVGAEGRPLSQACLRLVHRNILRAGLDAAGGR